MGIVETCRGDRTVTSFSDQERVSRFEDAAYVTQWALSADEMAEHRRPFLEAGDDRWPTLQWAREVPLSGEPVDVRDCRLLRMAENSAAEALYRRGARCVHLGSNQETGKQLP